MRVSEEWFRDSSKKEIYKNNHFVEIHIFVYISKERTKIENLFRLINIVNTLNNIYFYILRSSIVIFSY